MSHLFVLSTIPPDMHIHRHNPLLYTLSLQPACTCVLHYQSHDNHRVNKISNKSERQSFHHISNQQSDERRYNNFDRWEWSSHVLFIVMRGFVPNVWFPEQMLHVPYMRWKQPWSAYCILLSWCSVSASPKLAQFSSQETEAEKRLCNGRIGKMRGQWVWIRLGMWRCSFLKSFCLMTYQNSRGTAR